MKLFTATCFPVLYLFAAMFCCAGMASANTMVTERTEVSLASNKTSIKPGEKFWLALHLKMKPGWHVYWKNPGDSGMTPAFTWTMPKGFTVDDPQFPAPEVLELPGDTDYVYNGEVWLPVQVSAPVALRKSVVSIFALHAKWLVCKDICIPEEGDFSVSLPATEESAASSDAPAIAAALDAMPETFATPVGYSAGSDGLSFVMPLKLSKNNVKSAHFFPVDDGLIVNNAPQKTDIANDRILFMLTPEKGALPKSASGVVSVFLNDGTRKDYAITLNSGGAGAFVADSGILTSVLFAFLGGLILNLMPCVFPILALKALAIARKAEKQRSIVRMHGLVYASGVVASFLGLALVLILIQASGKSVGWGYQMQSPGFVLTLSLLFFFVALNLAEYFELPSAFGNLGSNVATKESYVGSFMTGALAVLVATPCTAPFMAPAIGFAITQGTEVIIAVFVSLGLGLAAPFLLLSIFPQLISRLPKPGAWMQTFKQAVAFPMFGCSLWLLWVLAREAGQDAAFMMMIGFIVLAFAIWLMRKGALLAGILAIAVTLGGMVECLHYAGHQPMESYAEPFSEAQLEKLVAQGKPVFVDATADWCITCKVNENVALSSQKIKALFVSKHITYMVADWTHGEPGITKYLQSFGRAGVPLYVYYPEGGKAPVILPQILTESTVRDALQ